MPTWRLQVPCSWCEVPTLRGPSGTAGAIFEVAGSHGLLTRTSSWWGARAGLTREAALLPDDALASPYWTSVLRQRFVKYFLRLSRI
jgi:hypothetical protein